MDTCLRFERIGSSTQWLTNTMLTQSCWSTRVRSWRSRRAPDTRWDTEVVDLGDVTLLPGLIDSHSHLVPDASDDPVGHITTSTTSTTSSCWSSADARRKRTWRRDHDRARPTSVQDLQPAETSHAPLVLQAGAPHLACHHETARRAGGKPPVRYGQPKNLAVILI